MAEKRKNKKKCFVPNCTESSELFHRLPQDLKLRQEWINACQSPTQPPIFATICSHHFKDEDYIQDRNDTKQSHRLKTGSIPSIFPSTKRPKLLHEALKDIWSKSVATSCNSIEPEPLKKFCHKATNCNTINLSTKSFNSVQTETVPKVLEYKSTQTKEDAKDLEIRRLKRIIEKRNQRNVNLKKEVERLKKENFKYRTKKFKKELVMSMLTKSMSRAQAKIIVNESKFAHWNEEDIVKGLILRSFSKKSYNFIRESKIAPLPTITTLSNWIKNFQTKLGFQDDILKGN